MLRRKSKNENRGFVIQVIKKCWPKVEIMVECIDFKSVRASVQIAEMYHTLPQQTPLCIVFSMQIIITSHVAIKTKC